MTAGVIQVEVIHAAAGGIWRRRVELPVGATLGQALAASGALQQFPELNEPAAPAGLFGRLCSRDHPLVDGDRVEIYRPLVFDPMESRRRRSHHRQRKLAAATAGRPGEAQAGGRRPTGDTLS